MQKNILWTGREYYSLENCLIDVRETGIEITSTIIGLYQNTLYRVNYRILTNTNWETTRVEIESQHRNQRQSLTFESDGAGTWLYNGKKENQFRDCIDVDIAITPFTNSLPINRLRLASKEEQKIKVIYIDLLNLEAKPVEQKYVRLSERQYHYENIPNDFEADITVDESGFVVDYPELFVRTFAEETRYR